MPYTTGSYACKAKSHWFKNLDLSTVLTADEEGAISGVKSIATCGPACHTVQQLQEVLEAGAVGARIDLTWGPLEFHRMSLHNLQSAMQGSRRLAFCMVDTLGRELMIKRQVKMDADGWPVHEDSYTIESGQRVVITTRQDAVASANLLPITYEAFTDMAQAGDAIYVGRYLACGADSASVYLEVEEVVGTEVVCVAKNNAVLDGLLVVFHIERSRDGSLKNKQNALPLLSDYDKEAIMALSQEFELDFLSLSYARTEDDVHEARAWLSSIGCRNTRVLAKIESHLSLLNFQGILQAADGIIISRGNLGLDCAPEKMAMIQKTLVQACNLAGKPVLITRVVDTMVEAPRPTRAEATDVANAVLDGVDGILLGAETLRGKHAALAIRTISRICRAAEKVFDHTSHYDFVMENALENEDERFLGQSAGELGWGSALGLAAKATANQLNGSGTGGSGSANDVASGADALLRVSPSNSVTDLPVVNGGMHRSPHMSHHHHHLHPPGYGESSMASIPSAAALLPTKTKQSSSAEGTKLGLKSQHTLTGSTLAGRDVPTVGSGLNLHGLNYAFSRKRDGPWRSPFLSKLESIASSAVRVADKIAASLMVVYTHSGATAQLVAKYRPPMPILTLVIPNLTSNGLTWQLQGRGYARQCLLTRGLMPVLANPAATGDEGLNEAVEYAASLGLVKPNDHIVVLQRTHDDFCVKVLSVDQLAYGIRRLQQIGMLFKAHAGHAYQPMSGKPVVFASSPSMLHSSMTNKEIESILQSVSSMSMNGSTATALGGVPEVRSPSRGPETRPALRTCTSP